MFAAIDRKAFPNSSSLNAAALLVSAARRSLLSIIRTIAPKKSTCDIGVAAVFIFLEAGATSTSTSRNFLFVPDAMDGTLEPPRLLVVARDPLVGGPPGFKVADEVFDDFGTSTMASRISFVAGRIQRFFLSLAHFSQFVPDGFLWNTIPLLMSARHLSIASKLILHGVSSLTQVSHLPAPPTITNPNPPFSSSLFFPFSFLASFSFPPSTLPVSLTITTSSDSSSSLVPNRKPTTDWH